MFEKNDVRVAAFDAPSPQEFERMYAGTFDETLNYNRAVEDRFILIGGGRLTFRKGEMLHFEPSWLDRERKLIRVPPHQDCNCSYCQQRAEDFAEYHDDVDIEEALGMAWSPKTPSSVRAIPYGWSELTIGVVEEFADRVGSLEYDQSTINRRVKDMAERVGLDREEIYPHALRAASGLFHAGMGVEAHFLMAIMGWNDIDVARSYLQIEGTQLANRIERAIAQERIERPDYVPPADLVPPLEDVVDRAEEQRFQTAPYPNQSSLQDHGYSVAE